MAVEDIPTQSTQTSTQPTEDLDAVMADTTHIWGSLIPLNPKNPYIARIDLLKAKKKYTVGRSRKSGLNDISFPRFLKLSHSHCSIEWDGEENATSAVVVTDLNSSNGTWVNGKRLAFGEHRVLRDWNVISFGPHAESKIGQPRDDYRFFFRQMAANQRPSEGLYRHYDVQHVLGRGAYATVVKAMHRMEGKWYAVKMFSGDRLREMLCSSRERDVNVERRMEDTRRHLRQEVRILQSLKHPYICRLKEAFYEAYSVSIVLELAPGGDLMSYVLKRDGLLEPEAQYFTYQICEALAFVHSKGVVHRDLKPENVLLTDDRPPIVKVADFGLAKVIDSLSMLQTKCGTPAYVAPEVVDRSSEGYDKVVDSWSLGVMIFTIITQSKPFNDSSRDAPDCSILREFNVSQIGIDFLHRLLQYDPRKRMTPAKALEHPWLSSQGETQRTRMLEREKSLRLATEKTAADVQTATKSRSKKRKAGVVELGRSLSTMSVEDAKPPAAKRARHEHSDSAETVSGPPAPPSVEPESRTMGWSTFNTNSDDVPGLGLWRGT